MSTPPQQQPVEDKPELPSPAAEAETENDEEEEEGECGFCLFMKGGGCKDSFIDWENCVQEAEKNNEDLVEKCAQVTARLKQCMDAHADYYEPILRAEEQALAELENETPKEDQEKVK
ncbi:uncharacterized protein LOC130710591 [Lotus japonicus]|uniref:uncharacterized protein LOC130710591 n=1 Tax=Lotus japonicus TaxID=34305 RepID=UPI00258A3CDF|nr:uncharacterized protein LOC130710591 [Lotus japonicus]